MKSDDLNIKFCVQCEEVYGCITDTNNFCHGQVLKEGMIIFNQCEEHETCIKRRISPEPDQRIDGMCPTCFDLYMRSRRKPLEW